jgi:DNA-binding transcriptional regulator YhcF (GntR family)
MSIKLDHRLLYLRVIENIKSDIDDGAYKEGEKLPSEFELSKQLGVSRATLREALRILEDENIVIRKHGGGTFINARPPFSSPCWKLEEVAFWMCFYECFKLIYGYNDWLLSHFCSSNCRIISLTMTSSSRGIFSSPMI